ncbi:MAG: PhzF family phenazine biosynthesis protein [Spirochaetes bacterium]|nr:PhzF family phenazine biosynthesis protein [Spirochaetota bacterium]
MKRLPFKKIDAFVTTGSDGNPAGYIRLDAKSDITEGEMLKIAGELKGFVNEVGFVTRTSGASFDLRYYSSEREVDFCGHATIAIFHDLLRNDPGLAKHQALAITTKRGELEVENRIAEEDAVFIMAPLPERHAITVSTPDVARHLKLRADDIDDRYPISAINAGLTTLLVPLRSLDSILAMAPDFDELKEFCLDAGADIIEVFTPDVADGRNDFRVRVFAPTFGYLEDPATGSGNSAFGYYLIESERFDRDTVRIEQNGERERFNLVKLRRRRDARGRERVLFGGGAITRIEGEYLLY